MGCDYDCDENELDFKYITLGRNVIIRSGARIVGSGEYAGKPLHPHLIIDDDVFINHNLTALVQDTVHIKSKATLAENISIVSHNHGTDAENKIKYGAQPLTTGPVTIGAETWIGKNVIILPGVEIGDRSIIAAGSVVTRNIPSHTIAAGSPCRPIKKWNFTTHKWERIEKPDRHNANRAVT